MNETLESRVQVLLRLAEENRFVEAVAGEPDYEEPVLRKAHHILTSKQLGEYEHAARLDKLITQVRVMTLVTHVITLYLAGPGVHQAWNVKADNAWTAVLWFSACV